MDLHSIRTLAEQGSTASKIANRLNVDFREVIAICDREGIQLRRGVSQQDRDRIAWEAVNPRKEYQTFWTDRFCIAGRYFVGS